jgi:hypothetical protein
MTLGRPEAAVALRLGTPQIAFVNRPQSRLLGKVTQTAHSARHFTVNARFPTSLHQVEGPGFAAMTASRNLCFRAIIRWRSYEDLAKERLRCG